MSNGIYDILGKLAALTPKEEPKKAEPQKIYESVEAKGSILEGVAGIEKKLAEDYASMGTGMGAQGGVVGEGANKDLADQIAQLLAKGNKVDSRVAGAMGHIVRAEGTHITLAKLNKPTSKIRYSWLLTPQRAEQLEIVKAGPNHFVVRDTDEAWGDTQKSLDLETPMEAASSATDTLDAVFNEYDFYRLEHIWPALEAGDKQEALRQINHYLNKGKNRAWWGDLQALDIQIDPSDVENSQVVWSKPIQQGVAEVFANRGTGTTGTSREDRRIAKLHQQKHMQKATKKKPKPDYSKAMDNMFGGNAEELTKNLTIKKKTNEDKDYYADYRKRQMADRLARGIPPEEATKFDRNTLTKKGTFSKKADRYDPETGKLVKQNVGQTKQDLSRYGYKFKEAAENPAQQRILDANKADLEEFLRTGYLDTTSDLYYQMYEYYANQMPLDVRRDQDAQYDFITSKIRDVAGSVNEAAAPGQEAWIKKNKARFIDQYGKKKGLEVLYATAWKRSKKDESVDEAKDFGWDSPEEKTPAVRKVTGKYGTEYQGDPDDEEEREKEAHSGKRGRGRPRKHAVKAQKTDGNGNKLGRGRPKKATSTFAPGALAAALGMGSAPKKHTKGRVHRMDESRMLDEAGEALEHILNRFKAEVKAFEQGADIDENLYDALYDYYVDIGEMPYGVQKARTGDPYNWVTQRLEQDLFPDDEQNIDIDLNKHGIDPEGDYEGIEEMGVGSVAAVPMSLEEELAELAEIAKLAGIETESIGAPQRSGYNAHCDICNATTHFTDSGVCERCGISSEEEDDDIGMTMEADVEVSEPVKPVNAPKKKYFSMKGSTLNPGEGDFGEKIMNPDRPTFKNGDNALSRPPVRESAPTLEARLAAEYESIKKRSK